jgi:hypothetical protein
VSKRGVVAAFLILAAGAWYWNTWRKSDSALSFLRLRVGDLRGRVEGQRAAAAEAVEKYQPQDKGRVDDLGRTVEHWINPPSCKGSEDGVLSVLSVGPPRDTKKLAVYRHEVSGPVSGEKTPLSEALEAPKLFRPPYRGH